MEEKTIEPLAKYFTAIKDPRIERKKLYPLDEIIIITILAFMSLAEGWEDIEDYGKAKKDWLKQFLKLEHGIPKNGIQSIAVIEEMRNINNIVTIERHYYISSLPPDPDLLAFAARAHP
ncbi:hypothetical protein FACS1894102_6950 [Spirochaetia bacterium]|nr:hypothetical protein FACS1894102_6950 [Spirochaetia bacterium]